MFTVKYSISSKYYKKEADISSLHIHWTKEWQTSACAKNISGEQKESHYFICNSSSLSSMPRLVSFQIWYVTYLLCCCGVDCPERKEKEWRKKWREWKEQVIFTFPFNKNLYFRRHHQYLLHSSFFFIFEAMWAFVREYNHEFAISWMHFTYFSVYALRQDIWKNIDSTKPFLRESVIMET